MTTDAEEEKCENLVTAIGKVKDLGISAENVHSYYKDKNNFNDFSDMTKMSCVRAADM